ncbi:MAG: hypothetical protein BGO69_01375 [Bacteroidetes bacterium 46-16]|nr:MAG: hypothetical protein BGO69_01375 [Bacteroidetes bacterium 46-16]
MESPIAVANYFIQKAQDSGKALSPMKLVKLVYIAHGWYLALTGKQLLMESVEAWKYGPVIPSIYHQFKEFGNNSINTFAYGFNTQEGGLFIPKVKDPDVISLLDRIWDLYSNFSAVELSTMTHMEGTPWYKTWHEDGAKSMHGISIPNDLIKSHYLEKVNSGENGAAH